MLSGPDVRQRCWLGQGLPERGWIQPTLFGGNNVLDPLAAVPWLTRRQIARGESPRRADGAASTSGGATSV